MYRIRVEVKTPYDVLVGENILTGAFGEIASVLKGGKVLLVTDSGVPKFLVDKVANGLKGEKKAVSLYTLPQGEGSKTAESLLGILSFLADGCFDRGDGLVALGGGMVGDVVGLAASLYMRGISYVQLPTTLLAGVDSSVGGKTAIDLPQGKNLVGTFYQPSLVVCDVAAFKTLSAGDMLCGLGEILKYGILVRGELLNRLRACRYDGRTNLLTESTPSGEEVCDISSLVAECVKIKAEVVGADERDCGLRKRLNLGHTVGHAIEKLSGYTLPHGVCVAKGLMIMAEMGEALGEPCSAVAKEISGIASRLGIPLDCPFEWKDLVAAMRHDKKSVGDGLTLVLSLDGGEVVFKYVDFSVLEGLL